MDSLMMLIVTAIDLYQDTVPQIQMTAIGQFLLYNVIAVPIAAVAFITFGGVKLAPWMLSFLDVTVVT
jgi:hypothetical protein